MVTERDVWTARLRALDRKKGFPFLASALFGLVPVFTEEVPTLATDQWWRVYINPTFFAQCSDDEGAMVLVHEVWHLLGKHWDRALNFGVKPEERIMWNWATDAEINGKDQLYKRLPSFAGPPITTQVLGVSDSLFAEEIMEVLRDTRDDLLQDTTQHTAKPGAGSCGSCAHGQKGPWDLGPPGTEEAKGVPGNTPARTNMIRAAVADAIIKESQSIGSVPGSWLRWAKNLMQPKVAWKEELKHAFQGLLSSFIGNGASSWRTMSRRQPADPRLVNPGKLSYTPRIAVIMDTSGSMSEAYLNQGVTEIDGVLQALGRQSRVVVYFTDAAANSAQKVTRVDALRPIGGGGTDLRRGFEAINKDAEAGLEPEPDVVIVFTDGYTPWHDKPPGKYRVLITIIGTGPQGPSWAVPPDHRVVHIGKA